VKTEFRASFAKDLKNIKNKDVLRHIKDTIEQVERAQSLQDLTGVKKLKGVGDYYRIRVGEYRIGLILNGGAAVFVRCLDRKEVYRYFP
jgi:mRNA interferase RelE/StbE